MADEVGHESCAASDAGSVAAEREQHSRCDGFWAPGCRTCRCGRTVFRSWPSAYHVAAESTADGFGDDEGGYRGTGDPDAFDDAELEAALREFWRAEILDQPAPVIAREMNLREQTVIERLQAGRRDLLQLVVLTLHQPVEE